MDSSTKNVYIKKVPLTYFFESIYDNQEKDFSKYFKTLFFQEPQKSDTIDLPISIIPNIFWIKIKNYIDKTYAIRKPDDILELYKDASSDIFITAMPIKSDLIQKRRFEETDNIPSLISFNSIEKNINLFGDIFIFQINEEFQEMCQQYYEELKKQIKSHYKEKLNKLSNIEQFSPFHTEKKQKIIDDFKSISKNIEEMKVNFEVFQKIKKNTAWLAYQRTFNGKFFKKKVDYSSFPFFFSFYAKNFERNLTKQKYTEIVKKEVISEKFLNIIKSSKVLNPSKKQQEEEERVEYYKQIKYKFTDQFTNFNDLLILVKPKMFKTNKAMKAQILPKFNIDSNVIKYKSGIKNRLIKLTNGFYANFEYTPTARFFHYTEGGSKHLLDTQRKLLSEIDYEILKKKVIKKENKRKMENMKKRRFDESEDDRKKRRIKNKINQKSNSHYIKTNGRGRPRKRPLEEEEEEKEGGGGEEEQEFLMEEVEYDTDEYNAQSNIANIEDKIDYLEQLEEELKLEKMNEKIFEKKDQITIHLTLFYINSITIIFDEQSMIFSDVLKSIYEINDPGDNATDIHKIGPLVLPHYISTFIGYFESFVSTFKFPTTQIPNVIANTKYQYRFIKPIYNTDFLTSIDYNLEFLRIIIQYIHNIKVSNQVSTKELLPNKYEYIIKKLKNEQFEKVDLYLYKSFMKVKFGYLKKQDESTAIYLDNLTEIKTSIAILHFRIINTIIKAMLKTIGYNPVVFVNETDDNSMYHRAYNIHEFMEDISHNIQIPEEFEYYIDSFITQIYSLPRTANYLKFITL